MHYLWKATHRGATDFYSNLSSEEQNILKAGGWDEGSYNDFVNCGGCVSKSDALHDPATYVVGAVAGSGIIKAVGTLLLGPAATETEYIKYTQDFSGHALKRLADRKVTEAQVQKALQSTPFPYYHEGILKWGYYDKASKIFVAVVDGDVVTVLRDITQQYIRNLKELIP